MPRLTSKFGVCVPVSNIRCSQPSQTGKPPSMINRKFGNLFQSCYKAIVAIKTSRIGWWDQKRLADVSELLKTFNDIILSTFQNPQYCEYSQAKSIIRFSISLPSFWNLSSKSFGKKLKTYLKKLKISGKQLKTLNRMKTFHSKGRPKKHKKSFHRMLERRTVLSCANDRTSRSQENKFGNRIRFGHRLWNFLLFICLFGNFSEIVNLTNPPNLLNLSNLSQSFTNIPNIRSFRSSLTEKHPKLGFPMNA